MPTPSSIAGWPRMVAAEAPAEATVDRESVDELLAALVRLLAMLDDEVGRRWMTLALRLQIEAVEALIRDLTPDDVLDYGNP